MAHRRNEHRDPGGERQARPPPRPPPRPRDPAAELEAVLDELEVRFLLDPDTRFDTDAGTGQ